MNKQEINEKLKENGAWCTECHTGETDRYVKIKKAMELVGQLDEPQKIVVPQSVADIIEYYRSEGVILEDIILCYKSWLSLPEGNRKPEFNWIDANLEMFIRAWLDGYEIKKEPLYCVKIGKGYFSGFDETKVTYVIDDAPGALAQRIKYNSKEEAEMDALQIGGTVEEVVMSDDLTTKQYEYAKKTGDWESGKVLTYGQALNDNQKIVLEQLKINAGSNGSLTKAIHSLFNLLTISSNKLEKDGAEGLLKAKNALARLTRKQAAEVLAAFAQWGLEQEEA